MDGGAQDLAVFHSSIVDGVEARRVKAPQSEVLPCMCPEMPLELRQAVDRSRKTNSRQRAGANSVKFPSRRALVGWRVALAEASRARTKEGEGAPVAASGTKRLQMKTGTFGLRQSFFHCSPSPLLTNTQHYTTQYIHGYNHPSFWHPSAVLNSSRDHPGILDNLRSWNVDEAL